jgi:hypothetical protein
VYYPLSNGVGDHASQFCNAYVFRKEVRSGLQMVWLTLDVLLDFLEERNNRIFSHKVSSEEMLFASVKRISWWWLKSRKKKFSYDLNMWWLNPLF